MARKTRRVITEEEIPERPPESIIEDPDTETLDYVLKGFDSRDGLEVKYYLMQHTGSAFVGSFPDIIPETQLQEWYPQGGRFEVRFYIHGEFRERRTLSIAARPGGMSAPGGSDGGTLALMREMMLEMRAMRSAPSSSATELATAIGALKDVMGPPPQTNINDTIQTAITLAKMIKGVPEEDDSFMGVVKGVVKEAGPAVLQGLMSAQKNGGPPAPPAAQLPPDPNEHMNQVLKSGIVFLKKKALAGADPGLYIDFAIDNREDPNFAPIIHAILTQQFEVFATIDSEIGKPPYNSFFQSLYDGIRSAFTQPSEVVADSGGKGGNIADIAGHAKPSKAGRG